MILSMINDEVFILLIAGVLILLVSSLIFAAMTLVFRKMNILTAARWERLEAEWEPPLLEVLSGEKPPKHLLLKVGGDDRLYFVDFLLRYAKKLKGREADIISEIARPFLVEMAHRTRGGDPERRARAVMTLAVLGIDVYGDKIIEALDDDSPLVAMIAARSLMRRGNANHLPHILDRLERFEEWNPGFLAENLASLGPTAAPGLREIFLDETRGLSARLVAGNGLRKICDPEAADAALSVLEREQLPELIKVSLGILAAVGDDRAKPIVLRLIGHPDAFVRSEALEVLSIIDSDAAEERLVMALLDPSPWVARRAAEALFKTGKSGILENIAESEDPRASLAREVIERGKMI